MDGGFCHYCRKAACICDDDKAIAKEFGEMSADLPDREPTVEEFRRLRNVAAAADSEIASEFEAYEFKAGTHGEECNIGAYSDEIAAYLAYAANHALTLLDRLRTVNEGLVEALEVAADQYHFDMNHNASTATIGWRACKYAQCVKAQEFLGVGESK